MRGLGLTSIVVSHDVQELATIAHDSYLMSDGKVVAPGHPDGALVSGLGVVNQFTTGSDDGPVPFHYPAPDYDRRNCWEGDE